MPKQLKTTTSQASVDKPHRRKFLKYAAFSGAVVVLNVLANKMTGFSDAVTGDKKAVSLKTKSKKTKLGNDFSMVESKGELRVYNKEGDNLFIFERD